MTPVYGTLAQLADVMVDHRAVHERIIQTYDIKSIVEFGLGMGTRTFFEFCNRVTSIEFYSPNDDLADSLKISSEEWMNICKANEEFVKFKNWELIPIEVGPRTIEAEWDVTGKGPRQVSRGDNPSSDEYIQELEDGLSDIQFEKFDLAFVDAGIHLRGDLVNLMIDKVNIITDHDTNQPEIYGYKRIVPPEHYVKFSAGLPWGTLQGVDIYVNTLFTDKVPLDPWNSVIV